MTQVLAAVNERPGPISGKGKSGCRAHRGQEILIELLL